MGESMFGVFVSILVSIFVFQNAFALFLHRALYDVADQKTPEKCGYRKKNLQSRTNNKKETIRMDGFFLVTRTGIEPMLPP